MKLALTLLAFLVLAGDAHAQTVATPTIPGVCAIRHIEYGGGPATGGCYRFNGVAGEGVRVHIAGPGTPSATLFRPDGSQLCSGTSPVCSILTTGRYDIRVSGEHALSIQRYVNPVGCPTMSTDGIPRPHTVAEGAMPCFRVGGQPGMRLRVRVVTLSGDFRPTVEVVTPTGVTRCTGLYADTSCLLNTTGPHTVYVRGDGSGEYAISLGRLNPPGNCPTVAFATTAHYNSISGGSSSCYGFEAAAGDRIRVRVHVEDSTLHPLWEVLRPDGTTLCAFVSPEQTCTTDTAGRHAVLIRDGGAGTGHGAFWVGLQRLNAPVGCGTAAFGPSATRAELGFGETNCFVFQGAAGDWIRSRVVAAFEWMQLAVTVVRPDGTTRCSTADCVLDVSGPHLLLVRETTHWGFGLYWRSLQRLNNPVGCTSLTRGAPPVRGGVAVGASPCWRFHAVEDERVDVEMTNVFGDWRMQMEWISPSGRSAGTSTGTVFESAWFPYETGMQTIYARDGDRGYDTGHYDLAVD